MPPPHILIEIFQQYIYGWYCDFNCSAFAFSVISSASSLISISLSIPFFIIMDTTNNSTALSPAELALMEHLFSHMWPGGVVVPSQAPLFTSQPSQPMLHYSAALLSTQPTQPTLHYSAHLPSTQLPQSSTPITHALALAPVPSIHPSQLHSSPITQAAHPQLSQPMTPHTAPITELYLSLWISPYFHDTSHPTVNAYPSHCAWLPATTRATSSTQPFSGFNALSVGMMGQANQCCLTSAAATLPRQPCLVNCGGVQSNEQYHGPTIPLPLLPHGPSLTDCIYVAPNSNGTDLQMVCIRTKIYPPVPLTNSRVSSVN